MVDRNSFYIRNYADNLFYLMITNKEIKKAWWKYAVLMLRWFMVSLTSVLSFVVIANFILKNYLGYKQEMATCNDTSDGDFGNKKWLKKKGLKPSVYSAFLWWLINHSWNYIRQFVPNWNGGEVDKNSKGKDIFIAVKNTLTKITDYGRWTRASAKDGIFGTSYIVFKIEGVTYFQYSHANRYFTIQLGGGSEYRFRFKFHPFL